MIDPITLDWAEARPATAHGGNVMASPRIVAIYWGGDYGAAGDPESVGQQLDDFFNAVCPSAYFDLLKQFGVNKPAFLGSVRMPHNGMKDTMSNGKVADTIKKWLDTGLLTPPDPQETNLLYVLFLPSVVSLDPKDGKDGFHSYSDFRAAWFTSNLFYAAIPFGVLEMLTSTATHEMVEAFADRDGNGWHGDLSWWPPFQNNMTREVCDVCEGPGELFLGPYRVASFWGPVHDKCVQQEDLPPNDPDVTVRSTPAAFAFDTPTTFHVEATDPHRQKPVTGTAAVFEGVGRRSSRQIGASFRVPGGSAPITKTRPHQGGVTAGLSFLVFTPDEPGLWNPVTTEL